MNGTFGYSLLVRMSVWGKQKREWVMPSKHLIFCCSLLLLLSVFPSIRFLFFVFFLMCQFFASSGQNIGVSASTSVPPKIIQDWFPLEWTGWISLQSEDSQETSPKPQFKSINSSELSFLYGPILTSIYDDWKNHSLD